MLRRRKRDPTVADAIRTAREVHMGWPGECPSCGADAHLDWIELGTSRSYHSCPQCATRWMVVGDPRGDRMELLERP